MGGVSRRYHDQCFYQWPEITEYDLKPPTHEKEETIPSPSLRTPRQQDPKAPCTQFSNGTPELLAQVFLLLSQTDILCRAQQVCKQWHSVVEGTLSIQQYLFIKPLTPNLRIRLVGCAKGIYMQPIGTEKQFKWGHPTNEDHSCDVLVNPYLPVICSEALLERDCMQRVDASWRKMVIAQPTTWPRYMNDFASWPLYKDKRITGSCDFKPVESWAQMLRVKKDWEMPHEAWEELEKRRAAEELPEYEVWEEMTGERI